MKEIKNKGTKLIWRKQNLSNKMKTTRELKGYIKNTEQWDDVLKGDFIKQKSLRNLKIWHKLKISIKIGRKIWVPV